MSWIKEQMSVNYYILYSHENIRNKSDEDKVKLENKLRIEDEEVAQIREECIRMLTAKKDTIYEITQCVIHKEDAKIYTEDLKNILTSRIVETNRRVEKIEELKRKKLEFLISK
jgi:hypothetical protein